ncbi:MAG: DUF1326 domain-containing protein [Bryobacterales bacterium]|nr:DUF1326 domain-containing protein [Bryobacterales bacterium]
MTTFRIAGAALAAFLLVAALPAATLGGAELRGSYIESRNAEIYASHCFANSEVGIMGDLAVMAWDIEQGSFRGVSLAGTRVVAVVNASSTIGNPFGDPLPAKAMLIFDEATSVLQRGALAAFVKSQAGELTANVVHTDTAPIEIDFHGNIHDRIATLRAGDIVSLETREIRGSDSLCHLDDIYYQPLVTLDHAMPAFAIEQSFRGDGLGHKMREYKRSSAYLGTFAVNGS